MGKINFNGQETVDLGGGYTKKGDKIFFNEKLVKGTDSESFEVLNEIYAKDKNYVYYYGNKIVGDIDTRLFADPQTFQILSDRYSKDHYNVYFYGKNILRADSNSFKHLENVYAKDKFKVYLDGQIIENADPQSFEVLEYPYAKDKNEFYFYDKIVPGFKEPASSKWMINCIISYSLADTICEYLRSKNNIFKWNKDKMQYEILEGADPDTFTVPE